MKAIWTRFRVAFLLIGLVGSGCTSSPAIFRVFTQPPLRVAVAKMDDPIFPDRRRQGVNEVVVRRVGKHLPYTAKYLELAQNDPDYTVRAIAIRALNRSRDAAATPIFIHGLSDNFPLVRLEAAKALNRLPDPNSVALLIEHLQPAFDTGVFNENGEPNTQAETQDVRIAAAEALSHYKILNVARALVDMLDSRDFGIAYQARTSLHIITGRDFAYDQAAWLNYLSSPAHTLG